MGDLSRVDVGKVLQRLGIRAELKGKEWTAACPNPKHDDSKPSFRVRHEPGGHKHGFFKCWPCRWGGGLLELVRWRLRLEDLDAARAWIAGSGEAELAPEPVDVRADVEVEAPLPRLSFSLPASVCFDPFDRWPAPPARYWTGRGLEPWQVERWGIGYAASGRLGGRIVIPSRDSRGRPHSYTARDFTNSSALRYLQPEPRERPRLSVMFGEQHWPPLSERADATVVLVEGEINGLAAEADLPGIFFGAAAGNQMRELHAAKLSGWGRVLTMSDPDEAGDDLHEMIVAAMARTSTFVERLRLPEDPEINDAAKMRAKRPGELRDILASRLGG